MNKFQPVKFHDLDDFFAYLPKEQRAITRYLREMVFECIPNVREKLSYNVPFYFRHSRICFIWPGSVSWGKTTTGVTFGFCNGNLLKDEINYLLKGNRKQVYTKIFYKPEEIEVDLLKAYLFEAVEIDEELKKGRGVKTDF